MAQIEVVYVILLGFVITTLLLMAYYSVSMLFFMRKGLLEKSWKYLSCGAIIATIGVVDVLASNVTLVNGTNAYLVSNYIAVGITTIGAGFFVLGFRSHKSVFSPSGIKLEETHENNLTEEANH